MNKSKTLESWLSWISTIHPKSIALGLDRIQAVAERLQFTPPPCPVIIVGGTNGKGSCVATLEKIYSAQGYRCGVFTSPILFRHNEMLRIQEQEVRDEFFCQAYEKIEALRQEISLTPFEYHTLAVLDILHRHNLDVWILEVGLGGRLDAVNILDADVAIVTSIGIDHVDWLGDTRELIAAEKAGIFRAGRPAVCGDFDAPVSLVERAKSLSAPLFCQGREFSYSIEEDSWSWQGCRVSYSKLPLSQLAFQNLSTALMGVELLQERLPVSESAIRLAIEQVSLPGRIEIIPGEVIEIRDVAHNPAAVAFLVQRLKQLACSGKTRAVFSMLGDKDIAGSLAEIKEYIDEWFVAPLGTPRAASVEKLAQAFREEKVEGVNFFDSIAQGYKAAKIISEKNDRLLVFGSFHTLAEL